jgi:fluoride ion exporter CrcB/FEX
MTKRSAAFLVIVGTLAAFTGVASAAADATTVTSATDFATTLKDTVVAIIVAVVPMALTVLLARKALPWARRIIGI